MAKPTASMEDYLEAIALLRKGGNPVKVTAISKMLGVKKPSVTSALSKLSQAGLAVHERYGDVELTPEGARIAKDVYRRHMTLRSFLVDILTLDPKVGEEDACRLEHSLSPASLERLEKFLDFVLTCPRGDPEWLKGFNYYLVHGERDNEALARCQQERGDGEE
jgi:DtxR family transcriptional regulator, Mn-dependent transcriptional regulator